MVVNQRCLARTWQDLCCVQQSERPRTFADWTIENDVRAIVQSANVRGRSLCWTQHCSQANSCHNQKFIHVFQYSEFISKLFADGDSIFKSFDVELKGDFSFPRQHGKLVDFNKIFPVGSFLTMSFGTLQWEKTIHSEHHFSFVNHLIGKYNSY